MRDEAKSKMSLPTFTQKKEVALAERMVMSAFAGMGASTICQPLDVIKFQLQVDSSSSSGGKRMYSSSFNCAHQIYQRAGISGLYAGLSAAYLRQCMYGSGRMGIYSYLFIEYKKKNNGEVPGLGTKLGMGATAGSVGAFIGNPADMALVRMSADSKKPINERANYKGVVDCLSRIVKADGVTGLWKGSLVTVIRASVMGSCLNGITSQARQYIHSNKLLSDDGYPIMIVSSGVASVVACIASLPADVIKSRLQNSVSGKYNGMIDCARKSISAEGIIVLWRGFTPALVKLTPYTVISLTLLQKITAAYTGENAM